MENFLNQFECKEAEAGEIMYDTALFGNILLFVPSGKLLISNNHSEVKEEVNEGNFVLLPAEKQFIVTAVTNVQTVLMHAGALSETITEDPEWNPEYPVVLPIFPTLAKTISFLQSYQKRQSRRLN